ncbi:hypothetical protein KAFR_0K00135 [Kazachstania africana CBS 2517]|uniref:Uncharacterized protein n=1 Tax=Kazachstania africana (strain ATCC 22294 / BCRC 22015 / CBS 2517 / CECT 1963 / NBRC 1671 / NRRL Y-8276) TaxID=1071382 RepID=H2B167_KAZAF|nr:hypothetical protein KAFR_0K00135 [Kazachstania africana CBS 2517]CCF60367.1 hypothetical protein KAFR_0K00135 [Kazachstania africana CBS 2517]
MSKRQWNKYFAYTGDVANYNIEYGDFEYAKHGALVSASFAAMVLKNDKKFPKSVCKSAVSNTLINGMINDYLIEEYEPFWMFSYSIINIPQQNLGDQLSVYPYLDYPLQLAACLRDDKSYEKLRSPGVCDVDVARFALFLGRMDIFEEHLEIANNLGFFPKHLDFENEVVIRSGSPGVPIEDVYIPFSDHHPLLSYEELSVTDILNSTDDEE